MSYQFNLLQMGVNFAEGVVPSNEPNLPGQAVDVPNRTAHGSRKIGAPGQASYETHPVAPQEPLEGTQITGKADSSPKDASPSPSVMDQGGKCPSR